MVKSKLVKIRIFFACDKFIPILNGIHPLTFRYKIITRQMTKSTVHPFLRLASEDPVGLHEEEAAAPSQMSTRDDK